MPNAQVVNLQFISEVVNRSAVHYLKVIVMNHKMEEIKKQRVSLKDSGIGGLMNTLKKVDEALYEKLMPEYKKMVKESNIFK